MVPEGWATTSIGSAVQVGRGFAFKSEQYRDAGHPILRVSNISEDGAISNQDDWKYIDPSEASDFARYALNDLDILIVMVGATTGKLGFVSNKDLPALLNQNMWSLRAKESKGLSQRYFRYIARGVVDRFLSTMQGSARGFLRQSDFSKQTFTIPPLPEQRKIADILSTWDAAIEKTEALLASAKAQKRALMQSLLTGKRRFPEFEGQPWKTSEFADLFVVANDKKTQVNKRNYLPEGETPIVDQGQDFIVGYTNHDQRYSNVPVIIFGDHTRALKWVDFEFCPGADGTQLLKTTSKLDQRLGYYMLQNLELPNLGYSRHMRELKQSVFDYPASSEEQVRLASVFSEAEAEVLLLENNSAKLRTEKKALMQQLLTGKRRVVV